MVSYGFTGIFFMHLAGVKIQKTLKIIAMNLLVFLPAGINNVTINNFSFYQHFENYFGNNFITYVCWISR